MTNALRRQLHRIAAGIATIVMAGGILVTAAQAPARADAWLGPYHVENWNTASCLITDHSSRVYTYYECGPQRWVIQLLDAYPGTYVLHNQPTGRCLMQFDYTRVISSPSCDGSNAGFRWTNEGDALRSVNTGGYLVNAYGTDIVQLGSERQEWVIY